MSQCGDSASIFQEKSLTWRNILSGQWMISLDLHEMHSELLIGVFIYTEFERRSVYRQFVPSQV